MNGYVVCHDPTGNFYPGALILEEEVAHQIKTRGVVLLPCNPNDVGASGASGYVVRHWGGGWPLGRIPAMHARTLLHLRPGKCVVHWVAALREGKDGVQTRVDLTSDPGQGVFQGAPLLGGSTNTLIPPGALDDIAIVGGSRDASVDVEAGYALALYGCGSRRVLWLGVSAVPVETPKE